MSRSRRSSPALWLPVAAVTWTGLALIGVRLAALDPPRLGDDLRLLVDAAERWRDGAPLYLPIPPGTGLQAESLFYSYPPIVAQALAAIVGLPFIVIFVAWTAGATAALAAIVRHLGPRGAALRWPAIALAPLAFPFALALLLGNVTAWFPAVFGIVLAAVLTARRSHAVAAGGALAIASLAKLHPASLVLWLVARGSREGRYSPALRVAAVTVGVALALLAASIALGGIEPWQEYAAFLRGGAGTADLVSPLNVGPASQLALLFGLSNETARTLQVGITIAALVATALVARAVDDPVESYLWAASASLVILPVTWFHYPVALVPVALAAVSRASGPAFRRTAGLVVAAMLASALAILAPVLVWVAVVPVLAAARMSRPARA